MTEKSIVAAIVTFLKKEGCDVEKTHGSMYGQAGRADLYVLVPSVDYQTFPVPLYLEVKQPGKHSTPIQLAWARNKHKYGAIAEEVHSVEEVEVILRIIRQNA